MSQIVRIGYKFMRMMCWLKTTQDDVRTVGAGDLLHMLTTTDSAHAVHNDMRGHTGQIFTMGTGVLDQKASKQKMNTRSSTECEHVGTSEGFISKCLWKNKVINSKVII